MKRKTESATRLGVGKKMPVQPTVFIIADSVILTFIVDILLRKSVPGTFRFIASNPIAFLLGGSIIAFSVSFAMMFRKKAFTLTLANVIWLALGIVNCALLGRRTGNPLAAVDLQINMDAILMMDIYYSWFEIIMYALLVCAILACMVLLFIKTPVYRRDLKSSFLRLFGSALLLTVLLLVGLEGGFVSRTLKPSLYDSYMNYGFPYGFVYGFFDNGIQKPDAYSGSAVKQVAENIDIEVQVTDEPETEKGFIENFTEYIRTGLFSQTPEGYSAESVATISQLIHPSEDDLPKKLPNFIFMQLESFCDPAVFTNYTVEGGDPVEYYRYLSENWPSGKFFVPTVSGGTANTEFEVLTGCNLDFFGTGEFPFYSILHEQVCESLATDLQTLGYTSTFLHNYTGSFYYRNTVYNNLDFDTFASIEYMDGYDTTPKGWAKDTIFEKYILEAMQESSSPDLIYAVTVQTHGAYPELPEGYPTKFSVSTELGEKETSAMLYYVTEVAEVDDFIKHLTEVLSAYSEPTVLVLYGDHLPGVSFTVEDVKDGDMYATEYVIWANFPLENTKCDLEAYQLSSYTLGLCGLNPGVMVRFHQSRMGTPAYMDDMQLLEYDLMYGSHFVYGGANLERTGEMKFGIHPVTTDSVYIRGGHLFVLGSNYTMASRVLIDGKEQDTIFVSDGMLIVPDTEPDTSSAIAVAQVAADTTHLSTTEAVYLK